MTVGEPSSGQTFFVLLVLLAGSFAAGYFVGRPVMRNVRDHLATRPIAPGVDRRRRRPSGLASCRPMHESPRPPDLGEQATPVAPEPEDERPSQADPRSESGVRGAAARVPYWLIVGLFLLFALLALYFAGVIFPTR